MKGTGILVLSMLSLTWSKVFLNTTDPSEQPDSLLIHQRDGHRDSLENSHADSSKPISETATILAQSPRLADSNSNSAWLIFTERPELQDFQLGVLKAVEKYWLPWAGVAGIGEGAFWADLWAQGIPADTLEAWYQIWKFQSTQIHAATDVAGLSLINWQAFKKDTQSLEKWQLLAWRREMALAQAGGRRCASQLLIYNFEESQWHWFDVDSNHLWDGWARREIHRNSKGAWGFPFALGPRMHELKNLGDSLHLFFLAPGDARLAENMRQAWMSEDAERPQVNLLIPRGDYGVDAAKDFNAGYYFALGQIDWWRRTWHFPLPDTLAGHRQLSPLGRWIWNSEGAGGDWWIADSLSKISNWHQFETLRMGVQSQPNVQSAVLNVDTLHHLVLDINHQKRLDLDLGVHGWLVDGLHAYANLQAQQLVPQALGASFQGDLGPVDKKFHALVFNEGIAEMPIHTEAFVDVGQSDYTKVSDLWTNNLLSREWTEWGFITRNLWNHWEIGLSRRTENLDDIHPAQQLQNPQIERLQFWLKQNMDSKYLDLDLQERFHSAAYQSFNANGAPLDLALTPQLHGHYSFTSTQILADLNAGVDLSYTSLKNGNLAYAETMVGDSGVVDGLANQVEALAIPTWFAQPWGFNPFDRGKAYLQGRLMLDQKLPWHFQIELGLDVRKWRDPLQDQWYQDQIPYLKIVWQSPVGEMSFNYLNRMNLDQQRVNRYSFFLGQSF